MQQFDAAREFSTNSRPIPQLFLAAPDMKLVVAAVLMYLQLLS
jgi:hypothetical protein